MTINRRLPVVSGGGGEVDLGPIEADIAALESADTALDGRLDTLESGATTLDGRVDALESADTALDGRVDTLESTVGDHTTDLDGIADDFETVNIRLDNFDGMSNIGSVGSTLTVTPGLGNGGIKLITLTADLTISFNTGLGDKLNSLELVITQDATGGWEITWNETVVWPGGTEPVLSTAPGAVDRIIFSSYDGGSTWYGDLIGKGYA